MIQQVADPHVMLGGNRKKVPEAKRVELVGQILAGLGIDLIHRQGHGLAQPTQHLGQLAVGARDLGSAVNQENDLRGSSQRYARLLENLGGDPLRVVLNDPAGVDQLKSPAAINGLTVDSIARDSRLIAHNGAALAQDYVEQSGLADVGASHDDNRRWAGDWGFWLWACDHGSYGCNRKY